MFNASGAQIKSFVTIIKHGPIYHFHRHPFQSFHSSLVFTYILLTYNQSSLINSRHPLLFLFSCPCLQRTGICHVCDCNPARSRVLCREMLESSWITVWMTVATAASTVAVVTATAGAISSPWVASTPGRTTTKEAGLSVRLSCRATGGSHVCWEGSEASEDQSVYAFVGANSPFDK